MRFQAPRGTEDTLPSQVAAWRAVEEAWAETVRLFGYEEVRTPIFEDYELFVRSSGETSDVVSKEMYDFFDKGDRHVALKPEMTAPVVRAFLEHSLGAGGLPVRLYYCAPIFRYGRPGKGRLRQFHQVGLELIGSPTPEADLEVIDATYRFYRAIQLKKVELRVNNIGRFEDRARYGEQILAHMEGWLRDQSEEDRAKAQKNPMRLLDTKDPNCRAALGGVPAISAFRGQASQQHHARLVQLLAESGIPFVEDEGIVRGLDYYTDTVFEVVAPELGEGLSLCGGGRYDTLIEQLGGPPTPSVGVAPGVERALLALELQGVAFRAEPLACYLVAATDAAREAVRKLAASLRDEHVSCSLDLEGKGMKAQFKQADRSGASFAAILGDDELAGGYVSLKDLKTGEQRQVKKEELARCLCDTH
ncbi:MAG: histidine--tRNA ligase [Fimbriimonadaceae bacterium]|nr:histidine--tRNA ligase [Fimbriimonadaceae bacterium]QYK55187.1 MAG: histidine--tRNA ligase [Fimbriimonadaceae bacterium]